MIEAQQRQWCISITSHVTPQIYFLFFLASFHDPQSSMARPAGEVLFVPMLSGEGEDKQRACGQLIGLAPTKPVPGAFASIDPAKFGCSGTWAIQCGGG